MAQIKCEDCLKTYRPYRYGIALLRVLMYGFSDWWEFEDERDIEEQFRVHCRDPYVKQRLINKTRTYSEDDSFAGDFNFYYQYLENKRRKNLLATFLCFDCEEYYCTNCVSKHSEHFTFSKDDKYDITKWGRISVDMLDRLKAEGDPKRENMRREQTYLCDVVDVRCEHDELDLDFVLHTLKIRELYHEFECCTGSLHILHDMRKWLVTDWRNNCIKIFNVDDNKMTRYIKLSSSPHSITEIPSADPSQSLIAVSFPGKEQIHTMNIHSTPAQVVSSINVPGICYDIAYCNNKLITRCVNYDRERRDSIHVMNMTGEIINIIDLNKLLGFKLQWIYCSMSVHSESETIYVCHWRDPSRVISLSLDGQVLHSVTFTDLMPELIHVAKDQNVYVMSNHIPIYKLSADLRHRGKVFDSEADSKLFIQSMKFHKDKFYLATDEGHVYII